MYVLSNALKNITRNKGRNILMAVIILIIVISVAVCMVINMTASAVIADYKTQFGAEVSIDTDYEKVLESQLEDVVYPTNRQLLAFGESEYLQKAEFEGMSWGTLPEHQSPYGRMMNGKPAVYLVGNSSGEINGSFGAANQKLVEGKMYSNIGECLVEKAFAETNSLSIGDSFPVDILDEYEGKTVKTNTLTITGFFEDYAYLENGYTIDRSDDSTTVLMHTDTMIQMDMLNLDGEDMLFAKYYLKDPGMLAAFTEELKSKGMSDEMKVSADEEGYQKVIAPVQSLSSLSKTFMIVILVLGCGILLAISILGIRERKYEIGVLRAMGMPKGKVALGFFFESFVITMICLVVGIGVSMLLSQPAANSLLANQAAVSQSQLAATNIVDMGSFAAPVSELTVQFGLSSIIGMAGIALLIVLISSIAGILYVTRYEPVRILSERN